MRRYREKLRAYQERLERRPRVAFWLQVNRRFNKIEGKHLALVISLNLFVAVIPLLIIIYAFAASFSANRSFGVLLVRDLHLTGNSALVVRDTFTSARSGKSVALSISVISLLITGLDVSATAQVAYARAFTMTPLRGLQKYLRGAAWLLLLLADTVIVLALRNLAASRPVWFTIASGIVLLMLEFLFYLVTPGCCWSCRSSGGTWYPAPRCARAPLSSSTPCCSSSSVDGSPSTATPTAASVSAWR
jgi:uncharacterized BrkB/YihY/UPF0761 family membrane protein